MASRPWRGSGSRSAGCPRRKTGGSSPPVECRRGWRGTPACRCLSPPLLQACPRAAERRPPICPSTLPDPPRGGRPHRETRASCRHGTVHFRGPRTWNGAVHFTCSGRHVLQDLGRVREGPVDEILNLHVRRSYLGLHIFAPPKRNAPWCNGNTPVFGTVFPGSSPGGQPRKSHLMRWLFWFSGVRERRSLSI